MKKDIYVFRLSSFERLSRFKIIRETNTYRHLNNDKTINFLDLFTLRYKNCSLTAIENDWCLAMSIYEKKVPINY